MRLNLGCGPFPAPPPWVNVDAHDLDGVDVIAEVESLPFEDSSVELVYAGHVFEHMTYLDQLPRALAEIRRVLRADGRMMVVGPDLAVAIDRFPEEVAGIMPTDPEGLEPALHSWPCTQDMMRAALEHDGWTVTGMLITHVPEPWPVVSRISWQFAMEATP